MNKSKFLKTLEENTEDKQLKIDCCQYFINNYPVKLQQANPRNPFEVIDFWTKIVDVNGKNIVINGGSDEFVNHAFSKLRENIEELKKI